MGETPRKAPNHLNGWARSSDVRSLLKGCPLEWAATLLAHDEDKRDNINFDLGTAFHTIPEEVLAGGMDIDSAIEHSIHVLDELLARHKSDDPISGKRSLNPKILARNLDRMGRQWWDDWQHSGFSKHWDVAVELNVVVDDLLRTQLDCLLTMPDTDLFTIIDWKSGTSKRSDSLQLWVYEWGLRRNGTIPDDGHVESWFYHAWDGHWQKADPYPRGSIIEAMLEETFVRKSTMTSAPPVAIPSWYCDYCAVQYSLCPAFNDGSWEKVEALWEERQPVLVNMEGKAIG